VTTLRNRKFTENAIRWHDWTKLASGGYTKETVKYVGSENVHNKHTATKISLKSEYDHKNNKYYVTSTNLSEANL
jgi:hypothetical protein